MNLSDAIRRLRTLNLADALHLRPPYPQVVVEVDQDEMTLVRVKPRRRGRPVLEAYQACPVHGEAVPDSIFHAVGGSTEELGRWLGELFESSGTRPGRVTLLLPDNLAKITLQHLPERPGSQRDLDELVRAKMRRALPFRLDETCLSYQVLPGEGRGVAVLVVLVRKNIVERFEQALETIGSRPGLVDISTPNLINLCRKRLDEASSSGEDAVLLNCARNYFSLVIVRRGRMIFFRCKSFTVNPGEPTVANGALVREVANSLSYYREKLDGQGIGTVFVRSLSAPVEEIAGKLASLGCERTETIDARTVVDPGEGVQLGPGEAQRLASAIGAAWRGR